MSSGERYCRRSGQPKQLGEVPRGAARGGRSPPSPRGSSRPSSGPRPRARRPGRSRSPRRRASRGRWRRGRCRAATSTSSPGAEPDQHADEGGAAVLHALQLLEQAAAVVGVGGVGAGVARAEDARAAAEGVDHEAGVVGDHDGVGGRLGAQRGGLDPGVLQEGGAGLGAGRSPRARRSRSAPASSGSSSATLSRLPVARTTFSGRPSRRGAAAPTAASWAAVSSRTPASARSSRTSSSAREKVAPSAVACTSTSRPEPVITTFMSDSARESSA